MGWGGLRGGWGSCFAHASKLASWWHSVFPQIGQLLRNTRSLGSTFNTVLMGLLGSVFGCQCSSRLAKSTYVRLLPKPTLVCRHECSCFWTASSCRRIQWLCRQTDRTPNIHIIPPTIHPPAQLLLWAPHPHPTPPACALTTVYLSSYPQFVTFGEEAHLYGGFVLSQHCAGYFYIYGLLF